LLAVTWLSQLADTTRSRGSTRQIAPGVAPLQFLIISSPTEKKVAWTTLENFASSDGRAFPLISSGLIEPKGLAIDHKNGFLYIADSGAKMIFRYTLLPVTSGTKPTLETSGVRLTVSQGHPVEWVTVDDAGNLFYTAPDTNNINKIPASTLEKIGNGLIQPSALQIVSEKTLEVKSMLAKRSPTAAPIELTDQPPEPPLIYSMYEANLNPHVSVPASIWADGADLYWTNGQNGKTAGTVVKGEVSPKSQLSKSGPSPFPATSLTNITDGAFGLAKANKFVFFSRNGLVPGTGLVSGLVEGTNLVIDITNRVVRPRGLAWDKDQTMYVADEDLGNIWSFPSGRLTSNMPMTKTVHLPGAFGLAIFSSKDQAYSDNQENVRRDNFDETSKEAMSKMKRNIFMETGRNYFTGLDASSREQGRLSSMTMMAAMLALFI